MLRLLPCFDNDCWLLGEEYRVLTESCRMVFDGHPDTISIRVVLVPTIEDVTVVLDTSKRIMGKSRCHEHIFINAFEVFGKEFLHSTCAIYLGVDLQ